jgi:hypothetical protein
LEGLGEASAIASFLAMTANPLNPAVEPSLRGTKQSPEKPYILVVWAIASSLAMTGVVARAIASSLAMTGVFPASGDRSLRENPFNPLSNPFNLREKKNFPASDGRSPVGY